MHEGHRKRMIERLRNHPEGMQDHELLEALLFFAIPRRNTNPLAHQLIWSFGSLEGVLSASYEQLLTVDGVGEHTASMLTCVAKLAHRLPERGVKPPRFASLNSLSEYLARHFERLSYEYLEFYFVDGSNMIRFRKRYTDLREDAAMVSPEEITRVISAQKPAGVIVAHNHPNGPCRPSREDDQFTAKLAVLCSVTNVRLHDHIIVGRDGIYSYFREGRMEEFREAYNVNRITGGKYS